MSSQLQTIEAKPLQAVSQQPAWTEADVMAVKSLIAKDANDSEMKLFLYTATQRGLNPLLRQIYCIHRGGKMSIQTGIDGYRLIANRTKKLKGIERGIRYDDKGDMYAWAKVYRKDWDYPAYEEVALKEYRGSTPTWSNMPETMLKKVAEAAALRMAFPEDLSGLYTQEEMDQADRHGPIRPEEVADAQARCEDAALKDQKKMKEVLASITTIQKEQGWSKEEVQMITGVETLKGLDLDDLEEVHQLLVEQIGVSQTIEAEASIITTPETQQQGVFNQDEEAIRDTFNAVKNERIKGLKRDMQHLLD